MTERVGAEPQLAERAEALVRARGLTVDFGPRRVLADVDLDVAPGEFLGLVGPNGAGKTTLLRGLLGLVPLAAGTSTIDGVAPRKAWRKTGYVPQRHTFAWEFPISVEQVVMTGRVRHLGWLRTAKAADYRLCRRALERVEMADLAQRTIGELSGGQKQRVLIARALATSPRVLFLDEPFTGVDMPTQELLTTLLRELADEGVAVLMTTHDLSGAMATCSRIALVKAGIVADGSPSTMRDPRLWMDTFGVSADSPLLASMGMAQLAGGHCDDEEDRAC